MNYLKKLLRTDPTNAGALVVRVILGLVIMAHGMQKLVGWFGKYHLLIYHSLL